MAAPRIGSSASSCRSRLTTVRAANEGYRAELQYIAPHNEAGGLYWGINVELARDARVDESHFWNAEFIPIIGWRRERWHLAANPGYERALSGNERRTRATPAGKAAYRAFGTNAFGVELYRDGDGARTLYGAWTVSWASPTSTSASAAASVRSPTAGY